MADGGAKDCLTLDEGDCVAYEEVVTGLTGLVRHTRVRELHALTEL